jgi:hypothetical protein
LESERRRSRLLKANPLGNSSKSIGLKLPSSKTLDVLAPTMMSSKITSMFALNLPNTTRLPPTVLLEDRFPCVWAEWKELISSLNLGLVNRDESVLVVLVPMQPGVFIMNPSTDGKFLLPCLGFFVTRQSKETLTFWAKLLQFRGLAFDLTAQIPELSPSISKQSCRIQTRSRCLCSKHHFTSGLMLCLQSLFTCDRMLFSQRSGLRSDTTQTIGQS